MILESLTKSLAEQGLRAVHAPQLKEPAVLKSKRHQKHCLPRSSCRLVSQIILLECLLFALPPKVSAEIHFDREVRPILSEYCFPCHGPDAEQRKADLRLDTREGLFGTSGGQGPVVPGNPDASHLIIRVLSSDLDERMPPSKANHPLSTAQIEILQQWVLEGAQWQQHWAFEPIKNPPIPLSPVSKWIRNEVDTFIQRRHREVDIEPTDEASREEQIRRLSLDLHGLPPTPEAISRFVNDPRSDAYI